MIDTRAATLNHVVETKKIGELPLNGRNPADLVLLAPGVASGATNNTGEVGNSAYRPKGQKEVTVNGSRNNNLRYTLDGGTNMDDMMNQNLDFPFRMLFRSSAHKRAIWGLNTAAFPAAP